MATIPGDKCLINLTDIQRFRPTAELDGERITPFILEVQANDLRPILGEALYYDFMKKYDDNVDPQYTNYQDLLNGKEYTYNGYTVVHDGLIPFLSYSTLARFVLMNPINITRFGNSKKKESDRSEPLSPEETKMIVTDLKSNAIRASGLIKQYLYYNVALYPLYQYGLVVPDQNKLSVKFFDI